MLCISADDIPKAVSCQELIVAVEKALLLNEKQEFLMPQRMHLDYDGNILLLMPCVTPENMATKLVSLFPGNREKGLPVLYGIVVLNDRGTGEPLAAINGAKLTAVRTGAVGGVGVRYLSRPDTAKLGIVGTGVQGFHQAVFACSVRNIEQVFLYDPNGESMERFSNEFQRYYPRIKVSPCRSVTQLLSETGLIITSTTSSIPVIPDRKSLLEGKTFIGIGTYKPDMREFPESLFRILGQMFIDTNHALHETGDLIDPIRQGWITEEKIFTLGKVILGKRRVDLGETNLFKSVGMALFDLVVSDYIYQKAREQGIGTEVDL